MKEQYWIFTSKNGDRFIQTKNKYLAHALSYCRFQFMTFDINEEKVYSFSYSNELIDALERIIEVRESQLK